MPADRAEIERGETRPRKGRRLKLMESYGAFSDERLQEVTEKIRDITSRRGHQPAVPHDDAAPPFSERIGESIEDSIGEPIGGRIGVPIESPIEQSIGSPDRSPVSSLHRSPDDSPVDLPISSPIESPDDRAARDAVLLTENQAILYFCLQRLGGVTTSLTRIARETGISEHTLKSCLKKLREERLYDFAMNQVH
jgi:hypothetical protein